MRRSSFTVILIALKHASQIIGNDLTLPINNFHLISALSLSLSLSLYHTYNFHSKQIATISSANLLYKGIK